MSECVGMLSYKRNQLPFSQKFSPTLEIWFHNLATTWPWNSLFTIFPSGMNSLWITLKKVISVVLALRFASSGPWWWFCSPLYTLIGLDGVLTRCNYVSLLLIHEICVEQTLHPYSSFANLHEEPNGIVSHSMCSGYLINFTVIWWSLAASLWTIATVYRFRATDGWSRLGSSPRFQGPYILSKSCKTFRVMHARQSISVYNFEHYVC
jgi:hypothetical protein